MIIGIFLYIPIILLGQDPPPPYDPCDPETYVPEECEPTETPIDDGVFFLLAAVALYAIKKLKASRELNEKTV